MALDFYNLYKTYSNKELLRIITQPHDYQAAAVATAESILQERNLTAEDVQLAEGELVLDDVKFPPTEAAASIEEEGTILEPILHYNHRVKSPDWVRVLLFLMAAQYTWTFYLTLKVVVAFFRCKICEVEPFLVFQMFTLLYLPVIFFLIYKQRPWGWILLFADNFFTFFSRVLNAYLIYNFARTDNVSTLVIPILIKTCFLLFLWRKEVAAHFGIAGNTKQRTALISLLVSFVLLALRFWLR